MRSIKRRKQDVWVTEETRDDSTIEGTSTYSKPEKHRFTVSATSGTPNELAVGIVAEYSRYIISYDRDFIAKEGMLLFVDIEPELDENGELVLNEDGEPNTKPDYVLSHVMDTKRGTLARYGIRKVAGDA